MKQQLDVKKQNQWMAWMFSRMTMFFALGVFAAGTYVAKYYESPQQKTFNHSHHSSLIKHTTKLKSSLQAELHLTSPAPEEKGDEFSLLAEVSSQSLMQDVNVKWVLPEGVELVRGSKTQTIAALTGGEVEQIAVTLKQLSDQNEQIHLKLYGQEGQGLASSQVLQFNSFKQAEIDQKNANLRTIASEQMKKDIAIKALQKGQASKVRSKISR